MTESSSSESPHSPALVMAGIPAVNNALFHRIRFAVGDPAAWIEIPTDTGGRESLLIVRDIEMERARQSARADRVACPADFAPEGGLSGDRETATAQAVAEYLRRSGVSLVVADRTMPLIFADQIRKAGVAVECDLDFGVSERRAKDESELAQLREAQEMTEQVMRMACQLVARADAGAGGELQTEGQPLTAERVRAAIDIYLLERGYENSGSIVAGGPAGGDCHERGSGVLRTGEPVIIDIFPRNRDTRYHGDCTRTVVHGAVPDEILKMHTAVVEAKAAATAATRAGVTGEAVHAATAKVILAHGYAMGLPGADAAKDYTAMVHGTGHGIGLDVHEPPLLDVGGPELVVGDVLTIEPGLYCQSIGGIRVEDMVAVTAEGCVNFNRLPEELDWKE